MIRKPTEQDFREGAAVTILRETKKVAVESGAGVRKGLARTYLIFFFGIMAFGLVMSIVPHLGFTGIASLIVFGIIFFGPRRGRTETVQAPAPAFAPAPATSASSRTEIVRTFDRGAVVGKAVSLFVPAILMLPAGGFIPVVNVPLVMLAIALMAVASLLLRLVVGDRMALRYDGSEIMVRGLLGENKMLWGDVSDVYVRKASRLDLRARFATGARRNLVIEAARNRLGGPSRLLVALDLLGLDHDGEVALLADLLCCRAGMPVPAQAAAVPRAAPAPSDLALDPRASFDPDAIMARYLAERDQIVATNRPDLVAGAPGRRPFGRKAS